MNAYSIETCPDGGYQVRVTGPRGDNGHVITDFATERKAQEWIDAQTQIAMKTAIASDGA